MSNASSRSCNSSTGTAHVHGPIAHSATGDEEPGKSAPSEQHLLGKIKERCVLYEAALRRKMVVIDKQYGTQRSKLNRWETALGALGLIGKRLSEQINDDTDTDNPLHRVLQANEVEKQNITHQRVDAKAVWEKRKEDMEQLLVNLREAKTALARSGTRPKAGSSGSTLSLAPALKAGMSTRHSWSNKLVRKADMPMSVLAAFQSLTRFVVWQDGCLHPGAPRQTRASPLGPRPSPMPPPPARLAQQTSLHTVVWQAPCSISSHTMPSCGSGTCCMRGRSGPRSMACSTIARIPTCRGSHRRRAGSRASTFAMSMMAAAPASSRRAASPRAPTPSPRCTSSAPSRHCTQRALSSSLTRICCRRKRIPRSRGG